MENHRRSLVRTADTDEPDLARDDDDSRAIETLDVIAALARGDLTFRFDSQVDLQDQQVLVALDAMARKLRHVVGRLLRAARAIDSVVSDVLSGNEALSSGVLAEIEAVERCSALVSQIDQSSQSVGESIDSLAGLSQTTSAAIAGMASSISEVSHSADSLAEFVEEAAAAIGEMAVSVRRVADSTEMLAESAEKTVRSMEAIDQSSQHISDSVSETTVLAEEVARSADAGSQLVADTSASVTNIKDAIDAAAETVTRLGRRSDQIGEATHVITEIADRTNLLALNAAILSAQAGAQGRGLRIVADEIKELSERTSASTREIEDMIKGVRKDVAEAIERIAVGGDRAADGVQLASRAASVLSEIREKTNAASERIRSIADAVAIQSSESHTVVEAADLVRQQARGIERATGDQAATAHQIGVRALHMKELTRHVRNNAGEQARVAKNIARAMEELTATVEQIRGAYGDQGAMTGNLLSAIEILNDAASRSQLSASAINSAVDQLVRESDLLSREVGSFQLPAPERGGYLRVALRASQMVLDPASLSSISRVEVMSNIFEGLVQFGERAEIRPAIAERWELSSDGCAYTFHLRETARFHNGRRVRSEDVRYSFERQIRQNKSLAGWVFRPLKGAEQFSSGELEIVPGIETPNEQTVILTLEQPVAFFLSTLCTDYAYIVPREEIERPGSDFAIKPVGSGPFRVVEPVLGKEVQLERFSNYWDSDLPFVDRLTVAFGLSAEEILDLFAAGELDYVSDLPLTLLTDLKRRAKEIDVLEAVQLHTRMLVFDCERPPLSDRRVRQAINYAIDRARFVQEVHGGMADPARGPIPPGLSGYDAAERGYYHDPARARLLLEEAGCADGFDTEIWWLQSVSTAVECICDDLAAVGIRAAVRYVVPAEMERALSLRMVPIAGRDWYADYPDSDNFTYVLFNSANHDLSNSTYSNTDIDHLTERARTVMNAEERVAIYREVVRILLEDAPCAFLAHRRSFVAYRADLEGMTLRLLSPFVMPKYLWFAR